MLPSKSLTKSGTETNHVSLWELEADEGALGKDKACSHHPNLNEYSHGSCLQGISIPARNVGVAHRKVLEKELADVWRQGLEGFRPYYGKTAVPFFRTLRLGHTEIKTDICIFQIRRASNFYFQKINYEKVDFCIKKYLCGFFACMYGGYRRPDRKCACGGGQGENGVSDFRAMEAGDRRTI
jgi:hypothetical protein